MLRITAAVWSCQELKQAEGLLFTLPTLGICRQSAENQTVSVGWGGESCKTWGQMSSELCGKNECERTEAHSGRKGIRGREGTRS